MKKIFVEVDGVTLDGYLNDSLAANEFRKRLPFSTCCRKNEVEYYSSAANGIFNPEDMQLGFQAGDITLWSGWFSIAFDDVDEESKYQQTIVIGHVENTQSLIGLPSKVKVVIQEQQYKEDYHEVSEQSRV